MAKLPTPEQMLADANREFDKAYRALGDAFDILLSDWKPGTVMTNEQADRRARMFKAIHEAKAAINEARS